MIKTVYLHGYGSTYHIQAKMTKMHSIQSGNGGLFLTMEVDEKALNKHIDLHLIKSRNWSAEVPADWEYLGVLWIEGYLFYAAYEITGVDEEQIKIPEEKEETKEQPASTSTYTVNDKEVTQEEFDKFLGQWLKDTFF